MESSTNKPVVLAIIVGMCLLLGAVVAGNWINVPFTSTEQGTQSSTERVIPDRSVTQTAAAGTGQIQPWQAALLDDRAYRSTITVTDDNTYVVPERDPQATLTGRFGVSLLEDVLLNDGEDLSPAEVDAAIERVVAAVIAETRDELYTLEDLELVRTTDTTTRTYFNTVARALQEIDIQSTTNELDIFARALQTNEPSVYQQIVPIATMYGDMRDAMLAVPVPTRYYETHLNLINVFNMLHNSLQDMSQAATDPLLAYVRFQRYPDDVHGLSLGLISMGMHVVRRQDVFAPNDPAAIFLVYLPDVTN